MKKIVLLIIVFAILPIYLFAGNIWIETNEGLGKYKYIEKDATTYIHYGTDWGSWNRTGVFVTTNNWTNQAYYSGTFQHNVDANKHLSTGNLVEGWHTNWNAGAYLTLSIAIDSDGIDPWGDTHGYNNYAILIDITTSTSGLATTIVDNPTGSENLVMSFKINAGSGASEKLKRLWVKNNGTAQEGDDIPNNGLALYYETYTGTETFNGDESNETLWGNYSGDSTNNELWGMDNLNSGNGITIPDDGLRCYIVITDLTGTYDPSRTANFSIINDGINLNNGLMRIDETPSGGDPATLPVELSAFYGEYSNNTNTTTLHWITQSETDNIGWNVYRNTLNDFGHSTRLNCDIIPGHGTTSLTHYYDFEDTELEPVIGETYWYWIESIDLDGVYEHYDPISIKIYENNPDPSPPSALDRFSLYNVPNPFNPEIGNTKICFERQSNVKVKIHIYNIKGELIRKINPDDPEWDGRDENGRLQPTGIYLYKLTRDDKFNLMRRAILLR